MEQPNFHACHLCQHSQANHNLPWLLAIDLPLLTRLNKYRNHGQSASSCAISTAPPDAGDTISLFIATIHGFKPVIDNFSTSTCLSLSQVPTNPIFSILDFEIQFFFLFGTLLHAAHFCSAHPLPHDNCVSAMHSAITFNPGAQYPYVVQKHTVHAYGVLWKPSIFKMLSDHQ